MKVYLRWIGVILIISATLNSMIEVISRKSITETIRYIGDRPVVFLINSLIVAIPFMIIFFVKHQVFFSWVLSFLWLILGCINGVLLVFRTTPFTAADFMLLKDARYIVSNYMNPIQLIAIGGSLLFIGIFCIELWKNAPVWKEKIKYGYSVALTVSFIFIVIGGIKAAVYTGIVSVKFGNIGQAFEQYGFAYGFSNSVFNTGISKPEYYGTEIVEEIRTEEMVPESGKSNLGLERPDIIMLQLESFFDPMNWDGYNSSKDPIPYFRALKNSCCSGYLSVPSVGAGTANTEFEVITGMNLDFFGPGEYPYKTILKKTVSESISFDLKALGYTPHAIHNHEGTFYGRHEVFAQLGFETFTPIEYMYHIERNHTGWCKDKILTEEILKALDSTSGPDFIYGISAQGHGAYPDFEYYCRQICEMDQFIQELIETLEERGKPVVLVLYGDHLPGFQWSEEEMKNQSLYQTEYVIWSNLPIPRQNQTLESYQLSAYVLDQLDIHEGTMIRFHQKYFSEPLKNEQQYLDDMKILEYDMLYGKREVYGGIMPYEATDLQLGITPIMVTDIKIDSLEVTVQGENFNEYSIVCVDGDPVPTTYVSDSMLTGEVDSTLDEDVCISVWQIGRDGIPLGEASGTVK